jgi:hypothetical protein
MLRKPLLVTVDVEGQPDVRDYDSVDSLADRLASLSIPVTLFVTPGVVSYRTKTVAQWLDDGHEVGLHIHPARTPMGDSDWLTDYDRATTAEMIAWGIDQFDTYLDYTPEIFRAGRWDYAAELLDVLAEFDFTIDCSLRPDRHRTPYERASVRELPLSVYTNPLVRMALRNTSLESIPMTLDTFLPSRTMTVGYYGVAARVALRPAPYLMVAFHNFDVHESMLGDRIERFVTRCRRVAQPRTVSDR